MSVNTELRHASQKKNLFYDKTLALYLDVRRSMIDAGLRSLPLSSTLTF